MSELQRASEAGELARLTRAVERLPALQRQIFVAHRVEGLTYRQIARRTRLPKRLVQRLMARALVNLCRQMRGYQLRWWERIW